MTRRPYLTTLATGGLFLSLIVFGILIDTHRGDAADDESELRILQGFKIAPVTLTLKGKNPALVGLGSYLVNAAGGCNDCHTNPPYAAGGNPFLGEPKKVNAAKYLAGGTEFIPAHPPNFPAVVSRNLTPDKTGLPLGGESYEDFRSIIRTGLDPDHAHPQYGPYLQVMPWPVYQDLTEHDLRAIYEYLGTIPCVEGDPGLPNPRPIGTRCK